MRIISKSENEPKNALKIDCIKAALILFAIILTIFLVKNFEKMKNGEIMWRICDSSGKLFNKPELVNFSQTTGYNHLWVSNDNQKLTNNLTCIWINVVSNKIFQKGKHVIIGVSNIDIYTGKTSIFQFKEIYTL